MIDKLIDRQRKEIHNEIISLCDKLESYKRSKEFLNHEIDRELEDIDYSLVRLQFLLDTYFFKK